MDQITFDSNNEKSLFWQIIRRTVEYGRNYKEIITGISRGCPLSPLLSGLDEQLNQNKLIIYTRYMDEICILAKTHWHLRTAIKQLNHQLNVLKVKQHPDKTFIGRIEKGFDFLGYHFSREPLKLANITVRKHVERIHQLYEQQSKTKANPQQIALVLVEYVKRWQRWCTAGLSSITRQLDLYDCSYEKYRVSQLARLQ